jgi:translocation and assembly module TamB
MRREPSSRSTSRPRAPRGSSEPESARRRWTTDAETIAITGLELLAFGGKTTGEARIPIKPGQPVRAKADFQGIDAGRLGAAFLGKDPTLAGKADGRVELTMPLDASRIDGQANLRSAELTVRQGSGARVTVKTIQVNAVGRDGLIAYDATAEGLGARLRFHGSVPVGGDLAKSVAEGEVLAVGFRLGEAFRAIGLAGGAANLDGLGAIDANIRMPLKPFQLAARGQFEFRDLRYGNLPTFGNFKGIASIAPRAWRLDEIRGDLMGGLATGEAHGETFADGSRQIGFDVRVDRASLPKLARLAPSLARDVEGYATLRVAGNISEAVRANAEVQVARGRFHGVPITDLRLPVELELNPANGDGSLHSRHWTARIAGGSVRGNAFNRFGHDHSFQTELQLTGVDLQALSKFQPGGKKGADGKVSGKITLNGPNAEHVDKIRGRIDLDLDDASLIDVPMFRELDKLLGSSGGGLFEDGDIHGTIYNKTLFLEQMTLTGRLVQIHATGSITMNGGLNLEILVNTNAQLSQPELAILNVVPGLGRALGEGEEAVRRVVGVLESSLLKFRVSGTTGNPHVQLDPGVAIGSAAVGFFSSVAKIPGR